MFQNARLKLTAWYLLIIMFISIAFSAVIYEMLSGEVDRFVAAQHFRIERRLFLNGVPVEQVPFNDYELVDDIKRNLVLNLLVINGAILVASGVFGYFLAGRTLKPIQIMLDDQNRFISDSSHELRTPLTSLKSALEVSLRDPKLSLKEAKTLITESIEEVDKLTLLSNDLLKLAKHQQTGKKSILEKTSLPEIVHKAIHSINAMAQQKNITIENQVAETILYADKSDLCDAFVILLDNAIKYSPDNTVISISSKRFDGHVVLRFRDQGSGIDASDIPKIFDRFYRADSARSRTDAGGYGLGLSIAKKIIETHKGTITVESKVNQGSTFIISLPCFS